MDRMSLTIDVQVNDIGQKQVNIRSSLVVANLIAAVQDKFNLDGKYQVRLQTSRRALANNAPLDQVGVTEGAVLVFSPVIETTGTPEAIRRGVREPMAPNLKRIYLHEERSLTEFDLLWQPALIGRKDRRDPSNNRLLAAPLDDLEMATTVSRHHAAITESEGEFFIESISPSNPTYLGDTRLRPGSKHPLPAGSRILVGGVTLTFYIVG
jgi:hypothetical protein